MKKKTLEEFIEQSKTKYGNMFNYSLCEYKNTQTPITLICPNNHVFQTRPATHLLNTSKGGCSKCHFNNLPNLLIKYTQLSFIDACNKVHNNTYDYSKTIYKMIQDKIIITCKLHGDFVQKAAHHLLNKTGCFKCGRIKTEQSNMLTQEKIKNKLIKFNIIHNNKYTYGNIHRENNILWLEIICQKHGSHITRFFNHEKGHGCPKCVSVRSNVQIQWLNYRSIIDGFIQHSDNLGEYTVPGTKLCVDGYNKQTNTIYEFQGDFWHGNPDVYDLDTINNKLNISFRELYDKTLEKIHKLEDMGYNVIYIWENDWTKGIKSVKKLQRLWKKSKSV
jgi:hypothetical protein